MIFQEWNHMKEWTNDLFEVIIDSTETGTKKSSA